MGVDPEYHTGDVNGDPLTESEKEWCEENDYRSEPFASTNWKTKESRDRWGEALDDIVKAHYLSEWMSVISDKTDRKAAIIHVNNYNREKWLKRVGEYDLSYRAIRYTQPYEGFSHKFIPTGRHDPERLTYAVVAQNGDLADKFYEAETELESEEKHDIVGELLNFPECCREFFQKVWVEQEHIDPIYEISCNSDNATAIDGDRQNILIEDPEPWNNVMYRYFNWTYLTHLPCSWDCEESKKVAKMRGEIMADNGYKDAANNLHRWLSEPMVWTGHKALAHIRNAHMIGSTGTSTYWNEKRIVWGDRHRDGGEIV